MDNSGIDGHMIRDAVGNTVIEWMSGYVFLRPDVEGPQSRVSVAWDDGVLVVSVFDPDPFYGDFPVHPTDVFRVDFKIERVSTSSSLS